MLSFLLMLNNSFSEYDVKTINYYGQIGRMLFCFLVSSITREAIFEALCSAIKGYLMY